MTLWKPSTEGLSDLLNLLREAISPTDANNVQQKLEYFNQIPEYNKYLVYILTQMPNEDPYIRSVAGLTLKNNIRSHYHTILPEVLEYIKECCILFISDVECAKPISLVISTIVTVGNIQLWPKIIHVLLERLDDPDPIIVKNAFSTFQRICEDANRDLDSTVAGTRPLEFMLPKFFLFFNHPDYHIRLNAINCVSQFILLRSESLTGRMNELLNLLFQRVTDEYVEVHKVVCQCLVSLLEIYSNSLLPHLHNLVEYMVFCTQSNDPGLALEACEFWLAISERDDLHDSLRPYLEKIVPVLLKGMIYSSSDIEILSGDEDNSYINDDDQNIKPRFHKAQSDSRIKLYEEATGESKLSDNDNFEEDEDEDEDEEYFHGEWNLRKCSAATLDVLCNSFGAELIQIMIPLLKNELESNNWVHKECGILALGAAAEGGINEISVHLPELVPYLLDHLNDSKPLVRSIACWTLGRYSDWIIHYSKQSTTIRQQFLERYIQMLLQCILDNNKRVQEAACSSFILLEEEITTQLVPYLLPILTTFNTALKNYQSKNLMLLYDTISALADTVSNALSNPQLIQIIIPPLIHNLEETPDVSSTLIPLLECLASMASALGQDFKPFSEPVYTKCCHLVTKVLKQSRFSDGDPNTYEFGKDIMSVALDLMSSILQAIGHNAEILISKTNPRIADLLSCCLQDSFAEVRQSAYGLLGDLAIHCFEHIRSDVPQFISFIIQNISSDKEQLLVCNNAIWAAGEITLSCDKQTIDFIDPLFQCLFPLMTNQQAQRGLSKNIAITIGRLGLLCPNKIAPYLESFLQYWLIALIPMHNNSEKSSAFAGLCEMIKLNPQGAIKDFPTFCSAVATYQDVPQTLNESFRNILTGYKNMFGETSWQQGLATLPLGIRASLQERYNV